MKVNPGAPPARPAAMVIAEKAMLLAERKNGMAFGSAASAAPAANAADAAAAKAALFSSTGAAEAGEVLMRLVRSA